MAVNFPCKFLYFTIKSLIHSTVHCFSRTSKFTGSFVIVSIVIKMFTKNICFVLLSSLFLSVSSSIQARILLAHCARVSVTSCSFFSLSMLQLSTLVRMRSLALGVLCLLCCDAVRLDRRRPRPIAGRKQNETTTQTKAVGE